MAAHQKSHAAHQRPAAHRLRNTDLIDYFTLALRPIALKNPRTGEEHTFLLWYVVLAFRDSLLAHGKLINHETLNLCSQQIFKHEFFLKIYKFKNTKLTFKSLLFISVYYTMHYAVPIYEHFPLKNIILKKCENVCEKLF